MSHSSNTLRYALRADGWQFLHSISMAKHFTRLVHGCGPQRFAAKKWWKTNYRIRAHISRS